MNNTLRPQTYVLPLSLEELLVLEDILTVMKESVKIPDMHRSAIHTLLAGVTQTISNPTFTEAFNAVVNKFTHFDNTRVSTFQRMKRLRDVAKIADNIAVTTIMATSEERKAQNYQDLIAAINKLEPGDLNQIDPDMLS